MNYTLTEFDKFIQYAESHNPAIKPTAKKCHKVISKLSNLQLNIVLEKLSKFKNYGEFCYPFMQNLFLELQKISKPNSLQAAQIFLGLGTTNQLNPDKLVALNFLEEAEKIFTQHKDTIGLIRVNSEKAFTYKIIGNNTRAFLYLRKALQLAIELDDIKFIIYCKGNLGSMLSQNNEYKLALGYFKDVKVFYKLNKNIAGLINVEMSITNLYFRQQKHELAQRHYDMVEELAIQHNSSIEIFALLYQNMASNYKELGLYDLSYISYYKSLRLSNKDNLQHLLMLNYSNLALLHNTPEFKFYNKNTAKKLLIKALELADEMGYKNEKLKCHKVLSQIFKEQKKWKEYSFHIENVLLLENELQTAELEKELYKYRLEQQEVERDKIRAVEQTRYEATEKLLNNILPKEVVKELLLGNNNIAKKYTSVAIFFSDIVGFTRISSELSSEELVSLINTIFTDFDRLAEKFGLEKIKTIGDAYMVVSGAPKECEDNTIRIANFSMEVLELFRTKKFNHLVGGKELQIRIGIHTGEVVAGVIGNKKFHYDMWGDTVNIASRMESQGEINKIQVSEDFKKEYEFQARKFLTQKGYNFKENKEKEIKGKGKMRTFYLEKIIEKNN